MNGRVNGTSVRLTKTTSPGLAYAAGTFDTLVEALDYAARGEGGFNYYSVRGELTASLPYRHLREQAVSLARKLIHLGLGKRDRVALIAETLPEFHTLFFACQYAGLIVVPMPVPMNLGGKDAYLQLLRSMLSSSRPHAAVSSDDLVNHLREAAAGLEIPCIASHRELAMLPEGGDLRPVGAGDACYIQYSSGSTRSPKGVYCSQRSVTSNARAIIQHGLRVRGGDRCTSWLPLYHDMGLVGFCLSPLLSQLSVDYISTADFARRPLGWLNLISENRGTLAFSPTFGYDLCQRRVARGVSSDLDLSSWRVAGIGGDMVRADVLERFADTFAEAGFERRAFLPSYGLAESTLAVSFAPLDEPVEVDRIDKHHYASDHLAVPATDTASEESVLTFALCGKSMPEHEAKVVDESGDPLPARRIGRVLVQGPSVMEGYFNDPEATARVLSTEGWLDTGDLGYVTEAGDLVITGRSKDLIICGGRNIWPQDIEWAVERLDGLRSGDVAAFSIDGDDGAEQVITVVQCRTGSQEARIVLTDEVRATVRKTVGVDCTVVLTPPRTLPVTSSGKLSRATTKARYLSGAYAEPSRNTA